MRGIDQKFIGLRAEQLAIIRLTDRGDLHLNKMDADYGIDLLASILRNGKDAGQLFGVQVKGFMSRSGLSVSNGRDAYKVPASDRARFARTPFPVILMVFTMDKDEAFWVWLKSPADAGLARSTVGSNSVALTPLTEDGLAEIVQQISSWYDSRSIDAAA